MEPHSFDPARQFCTSPELFCSNSGILTAVLKDGLACGYVGEGAGSYRPGPPKGMAMVFPAPACGDEYVNTNTWLHFSTFLELPLQIPSLSVLMPYTRLSTHQILLD